MTRFLLTSILSVVAATPAFAVIQLNFADPTNSYDFSSLPTTVDYGEVGNDGLGTTIYAQITALNAFSSSGAGSSDGDVSINIQAGNTAELQLSLFSDASYSTAYAPTPSQSFSWTATFADIEGGGNNTIYEEIVLHTAGSYTLTNDTELNVSADGASTTFSGQGTGTVVNPSLNDDPDILTAAQGRVAVAYTVTDTASMLFDYSAYGSQRNMTIDVGNLQFSTATTDYNVGETVPEPAAAGLVLGAFGISMALLRRKRA